MTNFPSQGPIGPSLPEELSKELLSEKKLTPRQEKFLSVLFDEANGNFRRAMELAGYSKNTPLSDILTPLRDEIVTLSKSYLALKAPQAIFEMVSIYDNPARPGANNIINVSREILDRGGVLKATEVQTNTEVRNIFILPPKAKVQQIIDLEESEYYESQSELEDIPSGIEGKDITEVSEEDS